MAQKRSVSNQQIDSVDNITNLKSIISKRAKQKSGSIQKSNLINYILLFIVLLVTVFCYPQSWDVVTVRHVFYYGWLTAISTGAGVIPFFFIKQPDKYWMGISNAIAGGMMVAASYSLVTEGVNFKDEQFGILSIIHKLGN